MPIKKVNFSIAPINENRVIQTGATTVTGGFSHKQGSATVRFSIPTSERLLQSSSLRLTGQIILKTANDNVYNNAVGANILENNGVNLQRFTSCNMPTFGGVKNCIDKVIVQSKKSNVELANVNQYGLYSTLKEVYTNKEDDYLWGKVCNGSLSQGRHAEATNRRINLSANTTQFGLEMGSKWVGQMFSMDLECDIFKGQNLHLGQSQLNGLLVTLHLAPDSAVFTQRFKTIGTNQTQANINECMYVLKNLRLEGKYLIPTAQDLKNYNSNMMLNARLNLVNDIHSDDNTKSYTPQLNSVKSFINMFQDEDQQNNLRVQQNNCRMPQGLKSYEQGKDNVRTPFTFPIKFQPNLSSRLEFGVGGIIRNIMHKGDILDSDVESRKHFERSLLGVESKKNVFNLSYIDSIQTAEYEDLTPNVDNGKGNNLVPDCRGMGVSYEFGLGNTMPYMGSDYSLNIKSVIQTGNIQVPTDRNNKSSIMQSFVRHSAQLNTASLVRSM